MRFRRSCLLLTALILSVAPSAFAARTTFRYDAAQRVVNACVLGLDGQTAATHPNPYVMEGLRRSDLVPDDWVFENPLAPPTVVTGLTPVVKGMRDYWFVPLTDEDAGRLIGMDLIYICAPDLDLTPAQARGLKAAVEAGALLWVDDDVAAGGTTVTSFPWAFEFGDLGGGNYARVALDSRHGLLAEPWSLTQASVPWLGNDPELVDYQQGNLNVSGRYIVVPPATILTTNRSPFRTVVQVGEVDADGQIVNREPFVVTAQHGSGSVVVTTGGVGLDVAEWLGPGSSGPGYVAGRRPAPNAVQAPDVKLALNMVQWNERWQVARGTPRASASTVARAPLPLDIAWQFPSADEDLAANPLGAVVSTPVYYKGMIFVVSQPTDTPVPTPARVMCLDANPAQDLDGDGQADDGETDYQLGTEYDMIWHRDLGPGDAPRYASPAVATYPRTGADGVEYPVDIVAVSYVDTGSGIGHVRYYHATTDPAIRASAGLPPPGSEGDTLGFLGYSPDADVIAVSTPVV